MDPAEPKPWGIVGSLGWGVLAFVVSQGVAIGVLIWWAGGLAYLSGVRYGGPVLALSTLIANPLLVAILVGVVRLRRCSPAEYLALTPFRAGEFWIGLIATFLLGGVIYLIGWLAGQDLVTPFQIESYTTTPRGPWLAALFVAVVIAAPLGEEVLFRGFLYRGLVRAHGFPYVAVPVIAVIWTVLHIQYDWFGLAQVFCLGLVFGWLRWCTGSMTLTFALHALVNFESSIETVIKVEWLS